MRRFDVLQDESDPAHVVLTEVYVDQAAADAHKQTPHYARWRDAVAGDDGAAAGVDALHRRVPRRRTAGDRVRPRAAPEGGVRPGPRGRARGTAAHPRLAGAAVHGQRPVAAPAPAGRRRAGRRRDGSPASRRWTTRARCSRRRGPPGGRRRRHRWRQRPGPGQGGRGAARQRDGSDGPPRGRRPRAADRAAVRAVRRGAHDRGHRRRGDRERGAGLTGARAQGEHPQPAHARDASRWSIRCSRWAARPP